ncbi:MAG TPA: AmmeMemoRadiSam system protein B [Stackebrandtia sp.]|uniref:AmmeMemoRadiSam system protein B n=1 Tax=Stackebrandtia sp. TaxID=2023065 RepID=UPI002D5CF2CD|nr:AmmeMemoRadiSam system protein B [Stackebrandtia sp.]HZE41127.1 AmmeMemoRadiSam system protein B [Stackebrandtia sp.]
MSDIRPAVVAGRFYPESGESLRRDIESLLDDVDVPTGDALARAYVVPHAGYRFSGPVAAHVYARLRAHADRIGRIVLIGPSHFVPLQGMAGSPAEGWETPLGTVATPRPEDVPLDEVPHQREHSLEVQLPFLQVCAPGAEVTPIVVGKSTIADIATAIDRLVDADTVLLCSTDLSHYHDEATARELDRATADAVLGAEPRRIKTSDACGVFALRGTVAWTAHHGYAATELDLRTSADTFGNPDRVVGYPAFSFG